MSEVFYPKNRATVKGKGPVVIGQKVYCGLYGGSYGIVYAIHGQQKPASIGSIGGVIATGGNAYFDIVFNDHISLKLPEAILHGVQWQVFDDIASDEDIKVAKAICEKSLADKAAAEKLKAEKRAELREKYKAEYPGLTQLAGSNMSPGKCAAKNIRLQLKAAFPGVKFSVKSDFNSVRISWENGPKYDSVEAITKMYQAGKFNGMTDGYDHDDDAVFASVFGDPEYVFCTRKVSEDNLQSIVTAYCNKYKMPVPESISDLLPKDKQVPGKWWTYRDIAFEIVKEKDIPVGQSVVDLVDEKTDGYGLGSYYALKCA